MHEVQINIIKHKKKKMSLSRGGGIIFQLGGLYPLEGGRGLKYHCL